MGQMGLSPSLMHSKKEEKRKEKKREVFNYKFGFTGSTRQILILGHTHDFLHMFSCDVFMKSPQSDDINLFEVIEAILR